MSKQTTPFGMSKYDSFRQFVDIVNELPDDVEVFGTMIIIADSKGMTIAKTSDWNDQESLSAMVSIRNLMDSRGEIDILVNGEDVELE